MVDVQSLAGDGIDNIPGAPGIGVKLLRFLLMNLEDWKKFSKIIKKLSKIKEGKL